MSEVHVNHGPTAEKEVVYVHESADHATPAGINFVMVLIVLAVLVALVAFIFYGLPSWLGSSSVNVNVRTQ